MAAHFPDLLLEVLANAARIDGEAAELERQAIVAAMTTATGAVFPRDKVDAAVDAAALTRADLTVYLRKHASRFSRVEKMTIVRELLAVVAADGLFPAAEKEALMGYIEAAGLGGGHAEAILDALVAPFRNAV
ncbi:MAG: hypothetical protein GC206_01085 [Alphaproteobacteria bacterium]|nr:hypothetical protein [Alphaproteobacteria bacterium]